MAFIGAPRIFSKKFKFIVEIDDVASAAFQSCSELSAEIAKVEHFEGGVVIPDKTPGRVTYSDVTLERGATSDSDLFNWFTDVVDVAANAGLQPNDFKRTIDIVQLSRDATTAYRWRLYGAWVMKHVAGDWDNNADETVIESVTLTYDYYDLIGAAPATGGIAASRRP